MKAFLKKSKMEISAFLEGYLNSAIPRYSAVNRFGKPVLNQLLEFTSRGKMLRGALVLLGEELFSESHSEAAIQAAGAMELFQSAFLVHDDVMDEDEMRRGEPSVFSVYEKEALKNGFIHPRHFGNSMAICIGDVSFFLGFLILSVLDTDCEKRQKLLLTANDEYVKVGLAQMQDVYGGYIRGEIPEEEVMQVYLFKTARYTFSLPLMLGAFLGDADSASVETLSRVGELLGLAFQIKDDELGLFGDFEKLGKPIGSDIREGKKTPFYLELVKRSDEKTAQELNSIFASKSASENDIRRVLELMEKTGTREEVSSRALSYTQEAVKLIHSMKLREEPKEILIKISEYNLNRIS